MNRPWNYGMCGTCKVAQDHAPDVNLFEDELWCPILEQVVMYDETGCKNYKPVDSMTMEQMAYPAMQNTITNAWDRTKGAQ